ncbi:MAG: hypothetical protein IPO12_07665 [Flavobacteriales bacterium]|nr:hypothetical protein [Flavobacteriales bacterium]
MNPPLRLAIVSLLLIFSTHVCSQSTSDWITKKHLKFVSPEYKGLLHRSFTPKGTKADAYTLYGKKYTVQEGDTLMVSDVYEGEYAGHSGLWMEYLSYVPNSRLCYVPMHQMKDVEDVVQAHLAKSIERSKEGQLHIFMKVGLYGIGVIIIGTLVVGFGFRCRHCGAWFALSKTGRTYLGKEIEDRWIMKTTNSGVGYRNVHETSVHHRSRNSYRCRKCGRDWSEVRSITRTSRS